MNKTLLPWNRPPKILTAGEHRTVRGNFLSLAALQSVNYILPILVLIYLIRVIGTERYGLIAFAQSLIQYFLILTDYGFNITATRQIALFSDQEKKVWQIFSSVMTVKIILAGISFLVLLCIVHCIPRFNRDLPVYILSFGTVIGTTLFPMWLLQGVERMKYIAFINIIFSVIYTMTIFIFVKNPTDYLHVPLLNSLFSIGTGVFGLYFTLRKFKVKFIALSYGDIGKQFKAGWNVFSSIAAINAYTATRIFAVGLLTNNTVTGFYSVAERISGFIQTFPLDSLSQAIYPRISKIFAGSKTRALTLMRKIQKNTVISYLVVLPIVILLAPWIVKIVCGSKSREVIISTRLLLVSVFFVVANAFKVQYLLVCGRSDLYSKMHVLAALIGLPMIFILIYFFSYTGAAFSTIILEAGIFLATYFVLKELIIKKHV